MEKHYKYCGSVVYLIVDKTWKSEKVTTKVDLLKQRIDRYGHRLFIYKQLKNAVHKELWRTELEDNYCWSKFTNTGIDITSKKATTWGFKVCEIVAEGLCFY